mgnify:CR=1 FL=1
MTLALTILGVYLFLLVTWIFYVAIMSIKDRLASLHWFAKANGYLALFLFGYPLDGIANVIVSLLLFQRLPKNWLLTGTLKYWTASDDDRRAAWASWICEYLLNPFNARHC